MKEAETTASIQNTPDTSVPKDSKGGKELTGREMTGISFPGSISKPEDEEIGDDKSAAAKLHILETQTRPSIENEDIKAQIEGTKENEEGMLPKDKVTGEVETQVQEINQQQVENLQPQQPALPLQEQQQQQQQQQLQRPPAPPSTAAGTTTTTTATTSPPTTAQDLVAQAQMLQMAQLQSMMYSGMIPNLSQFYGQAAAGYTGSAGTPPAIPGQTLASMTAQPGYFSGVSPFNFQDMPISANINGMQQPSPHITGAAIQSAGNNIAGAGNVVGQTEMQPKHVWEPGRPPK